MGKEDVFKHQSLVETSIGINLLLSPFLVVHALVKKSRVCDVYNTNGRDTKCIHHPGKKKTENARDQLGDIGAYGRIILIWILMK
jgi:hypothetical protein